MGFFRKAHPTIVIWCVSIQHFQKQNRPVSGARISETFGWSFFKCERNKALNFSILRNVQTTLGAHLASVLNGYHGLFPRD